MFLQVGTYGLLNKKNKNYTVVLLIFNLLYF